MYVRDSYIEQFERTNLNWRILEKNELITRLLKKIRKLTNYGKTEKIKNRNPCLQNTWKKCDA